MCKAIDKSMSIGEIKLIEKVGGKTDHLTDYRPSIGVITISDSISKSEAKDISGLILADGFKEVGCNVDHQCILPDGSKELLSTIKLWSNEGVELIISTGGTGLGPRDLTIETLEKHFNSNLPGIEQALHAYGRSKVKTSILSRLKAGLIDKTIVICIPGSPSAAKDALNVLIPTIFHLFHMMKGEKH
jgi:molybdenum cofactor synthesis domain-containing protein